MATHPAVKEPRKNEVPENVPRELAVRLDAFEGPMDLLLELIKKHEVDIFDIPIAMLTEEYLRYVEHMEALDLHVGGEWLEMAANLIYIKSKMLLPVEEDDDEDDGPDPRAELVRRLIEHQKYQLIAAKLDERPKLDHDVFTHRPQAREFRKEVGPPKLKEAGLNDLVSAVKRLVEQNKDNADWVVELSRETLTLRSVMLDVATLLQDQPRVTFEELFAHHDFTRYRVVTTFLALLEMTKRKIVKLMQSRIGEEQLYIERSVINILEVSQTLDLPEAIS
ncbi:hypothetical protein FIV42_03930 [Persicimonas caeni]|uniref:Segregation and condensation protein A n=1 Tax=Persicimonas caeni TaxID=2292766 RepID=A0A4Y6PNN1_PERCE|nr:segregation/condensation protein A [Persicimonas caeni]QDG49921.1 hypothetical protein FIV42_03930 [Persicimonas caeni]QED31142.1 hypothetical protein FRD00_03925 [Persicimonas caeni]